MGKGWSREEGIGHPDTCTHVPAFFGLSSLPPPPRFQVSFQALSQQKLASNEQM